MTQVGYCPTCAGCMPIQSAYDVKPLGLTHMRQPAECIRRRALSGMLSGILSLTYNAGS